MIHWYTKQIRCSVAILIGVLLCSLLPLSLHSQGIDPTSTLPTSQIAQSINNITLTERAITPLPLIVGQPSEIALTVRLNETNDICYGRPRNPADIVILVDTSDSAKANVIENGIVGNLYRSTEIIRSFWAQSDQVIYSSVESALLGQDLGQARLALITVDSTITDTESTIRLPFTDSIQAISDTVVTLNNDGADNGYVKAVGEIEAYFNDYGRAGVNKVLIFLFHDGLFAQDEEIQAAVQSITGDITIFVIGNTLNVKPEEVLTQEQAVLIAGDANRVFFDPTGADLRRLFVLAAGGQPTVVESEVLVSDFISPTNAIDYVAVPPGMPTNEGVRWAPVSLNATLPEHVFTYSIRPRGGISTLNAQSTLAFIDCNGFLNSPQLASTTQINVEVQQQQPTPTPTSTSPSVITATEAVVPSTPSPTPPGTPPPPPSGSDWIEQIFGFMTQVPWWCWLIPLLLFLFWLLWRWLRRTPPTATTQRPDLVIEGYVFDDANGNGIKDANEAGLITTVTLLSESNPTPLMSQTTNGNGHFVFSGPFIQRNTFYRVQQSEVLGYRAGQKEQNVKVGEGLVGTLYFPNHEESLPNWLTSAPTISGYIPTDAFGFNSSDVALRVIYSAQEWRTPDVGVPLRNMAAVVGQGGLQTQASLPFVVEYQGTRYELPVEKLEEAILARLRSQSPLIASWTKGPTSPVKFTSRPIKNNINRQYEVSLTCRYEPPTAFTTPPLLCYWIELNFPPALPAGWTAVPGTILVM